MQNMQLFHINCVSDNNWNQGLTILYTQKGITTSLEDSLLVHLKTIKSEGKIIIAI